MFSAVYIFCGVYKGHNINFFAKFSRFANIVFANKS